MKNEAQVFRLGTSTEDPHVSFDSAHPDFGFLALSH